MLRTEARSGGPLEDMTCDAEKTTRSKESCGGCSGVNMKAI